MSPKEAHRFFDSMEIAKSFDMTVSATDSSIILSYLPSMTCVEVFDSPDELYHYLRGFKDGFAYAKKS